MFAGEYRAIDINLEGQDDDHCVYILSVPGQQDQSAYKIEYHQGTRRSLIEKWLPYSRNGVVIHDRFKLILLDAEGAKATAANVLVRRIRKHLNRALNPSSELLTAEWHVTDIETMRAAVLDEMPIDYKQHKEMQWIRGITENLKRAMEMHTQIGELLGRTEALMNEVGGLGKK